MTTASSPVPSRFTNALAIIGLSTASAVVVYGILHDQVTWWMGLLLGVILAIAAIVGKRPIRTASSLVRSLLALLAVKAVSALIADLLGYTLAATGVLRLSDLYWKANLIPVERHASFLADGCAHDASYLVGFLGGFVVIRKAGARERKQFSISAPQ